MIYFNIYIKSKLNIDQLANMIRVVFNCNSVNQTKGQTDQKRFGVNTGGLYYLFEILGIELKLISNQGEVLDDRFLDYEYYLMCTELENVNVELFKNVVFYIAELLKKKKLINVVVEV